MDEHDFEQKATRYRELDTRRQRLSAQQGSLLYNTNGNSHHPRAFSRLEDALLHRQLEREISEIDCEKRNLAFDAGHRGFPEERWIKVEGPRVPDDEATGIKLAGHDDGHCELMIEDWALVLAEG